MRGACRDHSKGLQSARYALPEVRGPNAKGDFLSRDSVQGVRFLKDRLREQAGRFRRIEGREEQRQQDGNEERQQAKRMMETMSRIRRFKKHADSVLEEVFRTLFEEIDTKKIRREISALQSRTPHFEP